MSLNGVDVSGWNSGIDFSALPGDFVICKATQGTTYVSGICDSQYQQAKQNGKKVGVYHYAEGGDVKREADFFISNCSGYIGEAILCLDWESTDNPAFGVNDHNWVKSWCDYVYKKTSVKPIVYCSLSAVSNIGNVGDYGRWIAQYADDSPTGYQSNPWNEDAYTCVIRQYTSHGRLNGYSGYLDLNKFYGDRTTWDKYAKKSGSNSNSNQTSTVSIIGLVYNTMLGKYGNGDSRKKALGSNYNDVQSFINHIANSSTDVLVSETLSGKYGNGETRRVVLGDRYAEVQNRINNSEGSYYVIKPGDTLSGIASKYNTTYQYLAEINNISNPDVIYAGDKIRIR